jgi:hypothetical protein
MACRAVQRRDKRVLLAASAKVRLIVLSMVSFVWFNLNQDVQRRREHSAFAKCAETSMRGATILASFFRLYYQVFSFSLIVAFVLGLIID